MRVHLIPGWRQAWRWVSVHFAVLGVLFTSIGIAASYATSALAFLPVFSYRTVLILCGLIFACVLLGQLIRRGPPPDDTDQAGC